MGVHRGVVDFAGRDIGCLDFIDATTIIRIGLLSSGIENAPKFLVDMLT